MDHKINIIIADDHRLVRQGFAALLGSFDFVELIGEAADGRQLISLLRGHKRPDIILMDVEMPVMGGLEALEHITRDFFGVKVIMLTMLNDRDTIQKAVDKGAKGFLFKTASPQELSDAIRRVAAGEVYFSGEVSLALLQTAKPPAADPLLQQLSEREIEVLKLVAEGLSSAEIGEKLFISPRTVDTHRNNLIQKLGVPGIAGLVRFALKNGLC
jgi:DNA-binding NarL/FixJ family response regulator